MEEYLDNVALITGVTGQDGAYLSRFLLDRGYYVVGGYRRSSSENFWRLEACGVISDPRFKLVPLDVGDLGSVVRLLKSFKPKEVYNLAAQSFVGVSFDQPFLTGQVTGLGVTNLLEGVRIVVPEARFYQASTSEMFGLVQEVPQKETTQFYPRSPYGVAKLYAHWMTINYREAFDLFSCSGILFNHESPLRGMEFVTRKISHAAARIYLGSNITLKLGNLDARRDWGFAGDYVRGMWLMLQQSVPDDFVLATGRTCSVREFVSMVFSSVGIELEFVGSGLDEVGRNIKTGSVLVEVAPEFFRPAEVDILLGDSSKAFSKLGWKPEVGLEELANIMVLKDIERLS